MKEPLDYVEKYQNMIFEAERYIWTHPETGYRKAIKTGLQSYGTVIRAKQKGHSFECPFALKGKR